MDISIVIVNYKSKDLTLNCIRSIKAAAWPGLAYEILVADNSPGELKKDDLKQFGEIKYIRNNKNIGFGAANNLMIEQAQGRYVAVMNPDTVAERNVFIKLFDFMENNPKVGIVGPKQYNPDGYPQDTCFRWPKFLTPLYRRTPLGKIGLAKRDLDRFLYKDYNKNSAKEVDWLLGSFLFCRASALKQVGAFDQRFFLYLEDIDLCRRFSLAGWKVVYNPAARITHSHKRQSARAPWYKFFTSVASWHHLASWVRYLRKWGVR